MVSSSISTNNNQALAVSFAIEIARSAAYVDYRHLCFHPLFLLRYWRAMDEIDRVAGFYTIDDVIATAPKTRAPRAIATFAIRFSGIVKTRSTNTISGWSAYIEFVIKKLIKQDVLIGLRGNDEIDAAEYCRMLAGHIKIDHAVAPAPLDIILSDATKAKRPSPRAPFLCERLSINDISLLRTNPYAFYITNILKIYKRRARESEFSFLKSTLLSVEGGCENIFWQAQSDRIKKFEKGEIFHMDVDILLVQSKITLECSAQKSDATMIDISSTHYFKTDDVKNGLYIYPVVASHIGMEFESWSLRARKAKEFKKKYPSEDIMQKIDKWIAAFFKEGAPVFYASAKRKDGYASKIARTSEWS